MEAELPCTPEVLDLVMQKVADHRSEIAELSVTALERAGNPLVWDSVMLDLLRGQVGRILDDTIAKLHGDAEAEVADRPDPASVEIGARGARIGIHPAESLRAAGIIFQVALATVAGDSRTTSLPAEGLAGLSLALNDSITRQVVLASRAHFATWLDQVHRTRSEQLVSVLAELKEVSRDQLGGAAYTVIHGDSPTAADPPEQGPGDGADQHRALDRPRLTPREREVLGLAAKAMTTRQIAEALYVAEGTVRRHLGSLYRKLGASGRLDAVIRATAAGLVRGL